MGTIPDQQVADTIGVSATTVFKRRIELEIKPNKSYDSKTQTFSEFLRAELKRLKITQSEAAILFDVSQSMIEAWIAGPEKSWGRTASKLERAGIFSILKNQRHRKKND